MSKICLIIAGDLNIGEARRSIYCIKHIMLYQKPISKVIWLRDRMQKQNDENNLTQNYMFIVSLNMDVGIRYTSCIIHTASHK
jgi:hypothetical protein